MAIDTLLAVVQAITACAMAVFSYLLYRVSEQQRQLMATQIEAAHEVERGRLYATDLRILPNDIFAFDIVNCGRLPVVVEGVRVGINTRQFIQSAPHTGVENGGATQGSTTVMPGESTTLHHQWEGFFRGRPAVTNDNPLYVEALIVYTASGRRYEYYWGWVCHHDDPVEGITGARYVTTDYEHEKPTERTVNDVLMKQYTTMA